MRGPTAAWLSLLLGCAQGSGRAPRDVRAAGATGATSASPHGAPPQDPIEAEAQQLTRLAAALAAQHADAGADAASDERIDLALQLADAHLRLETLAWERAYRPDAGRDEGAMRQGTMEEAGTQRRAALRFLETAVDAPGFEAHPRAAESLALYASLLVQTGSRDKARGVYARIGSHWPRQPAAARARLSLGELAFEEADLVSARAHYEAAVRDDPGLEIELYAQYKLGWIDLNEDDGVSALERFTDVTTRAREDRRHEAIGLEASKDMVRAYARVGLPENAPAFFGRVCPEHARARLASLARAYRDDGKSDEARAIYRELLAGEAPGLDACRWQVEVVELALELGDGSAEAELERLAQIVDHVRATVAGDREAQQCANRLRLLQASHREGRRFPR